MSRNKVLGDGLKSVWGIYTYSLPEEYHFLRQYLFQALPDFSGFLLLILHHQGLGSSLATTIEIIDFTLQLEAQELVTSPLWISS